METQDLNEIIKQQNEIIAVKDSKIGILEERIDELKKKIRDLSDEVFWLEYEKSETKESSIGGVFLLCLLIIGLMVAMVTTCR